MTGSDSNENMPPTPAENTDPSPDDGLGSGVPVEGDMEVEAPRRAASAEFQVESQIGSHAALRDAMDPANQSLGEALRLSFRVLQIVILVLVVLFLASGFETVEDNQSGVLTVWGKVTPYQGNLELDKGLKFSVWPYPAGQFVLIDVQNRSTDVGDTFWPTIPVGVTDEEALEKAKVTQELAPGAHGSLITGEGDLAHLRVSARYEIDDAVEFISSARDDQADQIVKLALQSATVHVAGGSTLRELVDVSSDAADRIKDVAQEKLNSIGCGLRITRVSVTDARPPFAIAKTYREVQTARVDADAVIERAKLNADSTLTVTAGENYRKLLALIEDYEAAVDVRNDEESESILGQINQFLESEEAGGGVADIIQLAKSYHAQIDATLGAEARRFNGLYDAYQKNPELVVRQQWLATYQNVLSRPDVEVYFVPEGIAKFALNLRGLDEVQELRRKMKLDAKEQAALMAEMEARNPFIARARDLEGMRRHRQLQVEDGRVKGGRTTPPR